METSLLNRITIIPDVCNGKPTVRGMRITVETILQYLSAGDSVDDILKAYPFLERGYTGLYCICTKKHIHYQK